MSNQKKSASREPDLKRKIIYSGIMILLPLLFFIILELVLRLFGYGDNLDLFINHPDKAYSSYRIVNPIVGKKYFQKFQYTVPPNDIFLKKKTPNTFRIFVLGSSTVVGFPYGENLMFTRILHQRLQDSYPDMNIEVINTAITAINSYTLLDYIGQILGEKPDVVLIYAGHNEFYGAFGIGSNETLGKSRFFTLLHIKMMNLRFYQLLRNMIGSTSKNSPENRVHGPLMKRIVAKSDIVYKTDKYNTGINQYRANMSALFKKATRKHVPIFYSSMVCNVKDLRPFGSIAANGYEPACQVYDSACQAELRANYTKAKQLYYKARDLDCVRFRASDDINSIIKELCETYKINYVPMIERFEEESDHMIPGNNFFTEHVHPNIAGYFLMADVFYKEIVRSSIIGNTPDRFKTRTAAYYKKNWGYTLLDSLSAYHSITNLKNYWPFINEDSLFKDYRFNYKPVSLTDSLAFEVMRKIRYSLSDAHLDLAQIYKNTGDYYKAFKEYQALVEINPYLSVNYTDAVTCLIQISDLPLALEYLENSLKYEKTFYAYFKAAEIYLIKNDLTQALQYFQEAYRLAPNEKRLNVLIKVYMVYKYSGRDQDAFKTIQAIHAIQPEMKVPLPQYRYLYYQYIPLQIKSYIDEARILLQQNKQEDALQTLLASLDKYNSPVTNRMIGEIYLNMHNAPKALYYLETVYSDFKFDPVFLNRISITYLLNHNIDGAKRCLDQFKRVDPGNPLIQKTENLISRVK